MPQVQFSLKVLSMSWTEADVESYMQRAFPSNDGGRQPHRPMAEEQLLQHIRAAAKRHGYATYHTRDSRRSDAGWPDLFCTNGVRLLAIECKSASGKLTPGQQQWLSLLEH